MAPSGLLRLYLPLACGFPFSDRSVLHLGVPELHSGLNGPVVGGIFQPPEAVPTKSQWDLSTHPRRAVRSGTSGHSRPEAFPHRAPPVLHVPPPLPLTLRGQFGHSGS